LTSPPISIPQGLRSRRPGDSHRKRSRPAAVLALAVALLVMASGSARADRVHDLSRALVHGKRVQTRISAAISLGRLRDPRAVGSLVRALRDRSSKVRAHAAAALGELGRADALPALRRARRDRSPTVRLRALAAMKRIRQVRIARAASPTAMPALAASPVYGIAADRDAARRVHVMLKSASDKANGAVASAHHALDREMRSLMADQLEQTPGVTVVPAGTGDRPIDPYAIDLTVVKLERVERTATVDVECEIRVAISTPRGKMLSLLTGGAVAQLPRATFRDEFLPELRRDALEGAVRSVHRDLIAHLAKLPPVALLPAAPGDEPGQNADHRGHVKRDHRDLRAAASGPARDRRH
jgi:HEAT repeats